MSRMFKETRCHQTTTIIITTTTTKTTKTASNRFHPPTKTYQYPRFISYHHRMTEAQRAHRKPPLVKLKETLHQAGGIEVRIQPQWCFSENKQLTQEKHTEINTENWGKSAKFPQVSWKKGSIWERLLLLFRKGQGPACHFWVPFVAALTDKGVPREWPRRFHQRSPTSAAVWVEKSHPQDCKGNT